MPPDAALAALLEAAAEAGARRALGEHADDPWLDAAEAAEYARTTRSTIERHVRSGALRASRGERGRVVTRRSWVDAWMMARPYVPRAEPASDVEDEIGGRGLRVVGGR